MNNRNKQKSLRREYLEAAAIAIILALFIRTFAIQAFKIPSGSMEPTLLIGDHLLVNKFIYGIKVPFINMTLIPFGKPKRGDIIVFIYPRDKEKDFIKRVIGLPGDKLEIIDKKIFINDRLFEDHFGVFDEKIHRNEKMGPIVVPPNRFFVMGDNRDHSSDSRYWGFVPSGLIKGKAIILYWSWPHWKRFGHLIK